MSMANMRDSERLELLKEIGGAKVYEERRKESIKVINETSNNRILIEDMVPKILISHFSHSCLTLDQEHRIEAF